MNVVDALKWRYAVKSFDKSKKISSADWSKIEDALVLSASGFGLQPWKFVVVTDVEMKKKLTPLSFGQPQIENSSHLVVFCAKNDMDENYVDRFVSSVAEIRGIDKSSLEAYKQSMVGFVNNTNKDDLLNWAKRQCYIALGNVLTAAATMQIDACPMEGINPAGYDGELKIQGYNAVCICAFGYRSESDPFAKAAKTRFSKEEMIHNI